MYFPVLAIDIGYGRTKMAARLPNVSGIYTDSFPSLAPRHISSNLSSHFSSSTKTKIYVVSVNDVQYAVGPEVKFSIGGGTGNGRTLTDDFPTSDCYMALFLGALYHLDATEIDVLVLGLPVHTMHRNKDYLLTHFSGTFNVGGKTVTVKKIVILPQPVGAMIHYGATLDEAIRDGENRLIIDAGYVTTDWVLVNGYRMIESRSSGTPIGSSAVLNAIAEKIGHDEGVAFDAIERIDESLIENKPLRCFKKVLSPETVNQYLAKAIFVTDVAAEKIRASVGDAADLHSILMVGGSARYFTPSIEKSFPMVEIVHLDHSPYCNVQGFLLFGESHLKRLKAA